MAKVFVQRVWPDGETLTVSITVDNSFPDVVAEAKQAAVSAYEAALEISLAHDDAHDEADATDEAE